MRRGTDYTVGIISSALKCMQMQRQNYNTDFIPTGAAMLAKTIAETNSSNKKPLLAMAVMHRSRSLTELNA